jgi:dihydroorotate dehydrogenase (fumarate)
MADLSTTYCGLELTSPLVASAGPLTGRIDTLERLAAAGAAAVVLPSLFEEEIVQNALELHAMHMRGSEMSPEAREFMAEVPGPGNVERTLDLIAEAKARLGIPVIASLNGSSPGGWARYAVDLEAAGADAVELNVYFVAGDPRDDGREIERRHVELVRMVRQAVEIPLAVKVSPYFSAFAHTAAELVDAGADALVLFNRFYQPDIDLESLDVTPALTLSTPAELRLPLRWIALLHGQLRCALAASTGVHASTDMVKALLAGATVTMTTSALLEHGPEYARVLRAGLDAWLDDHEYESVDQLRGSVSARSAADPDAYERANYLEVLRRFPSRSFDPSPS